MPESRFYILIAEDDEDDQFLLRSAFREAAPGCDLWFVENGINLLEHFRLTEKGEYALPALLVLDLNMPKKNGREALLELSKKHYFRNFPTVVFSTTGNETERSRCAALCVSDFFVKPSSYSALLEVVTRFRSLATGPVKEI